MKLTRKKQFVLVQFVGTINTVSASIYTLYF